MAATLRTALNRIRERLQQDEYFRDQATAVITPQRSIRISLPGLHQMRSRERYWLNVQGLIMELGYYHLPANDALLCDEFLLYPRGDE